MPNSNIRINSITEKDTNQSVEVSKLAPIGVADGAVIYVDTVADLQALDTSGLVDGQGVIFRGTADPDDGGQSLVFWSPSEDKEHHNGITIIDPTHSAAPGSKEWYRPENTGDGCFVGHDKDKILNYVSKMVFQGGKLDSLDQGGIVHPVVLSWDRGKRIFVTLNIGESHASPKETWSIESNDYGVSWSDPEVFVPKHDPEGRAMVEAGGVSNDGTGYLFIARRDPTQTTRFIKTTDKGETWSSEIDISLGSIGFTSGRPIGQLVEQDGKLFVPIYGGGKSGLIVSSDGGESFSGELVIDSEEDAASDHVSEPSLAALGDGRLLLLARTENAGPYVHVYSSDNGSTWSDGQTIPWFNPGGAPPQLLSDRNYVYCLFSNRRLEHETGNFFLEFTPSIQGSENAGTFEPSRAEGVAFIFGNLATVLIDIVVPSSGYDVDEDAEGPIRITGIPSLLRSSEGPRQYSGSLDEVYLDPVDPEEDGDPRSMFTVSMSAGSREFRINKMLPDSGGASRVRVSEAQTLSISFQITYPLDNSRGDINIPNGWVISKIDKSYYDDAQKWRGPSPLYIPHVNTFNSPEGDWGYGQFSEILGDVHMFWYNGNFGSGGADVVATNLSKLGVLADSRP